MTTIFLNI